MRPYFASASFPPPLAAERVRDWLTAFRCVPVTEPAIRAALLHAVDERISYWDALLVATAAQAGCSLVLTEDMADGAMLEGLQITILSPWTAISPI